ncbi:MAG: hypothetical protein PSV46_07070 [Reyranella sp.]|nr:hypothetical protein [Reyranella sp.]
MTLRPEYSLGHSAYNAFLHAEVGEELNGTKLTVLTALTRLGIDPWQEAARLADLPRDVAVTALAAALARLPPMSPGGSWKAADAEAIATRLSALLPGQSSAPLAQPAPRAKAARASAPAAASAPRAKASLTTWLLWGVAGLALYFLFMQMQPDREFEPSSGQSAITQQ